MSLRAHIRGAFTHSLTYDRFVSARTKSDRYWSDESIADEKLMTFRPSQLHY